MGDVGPVPYPGRRLQDREGAEVEGPDPHGRLKRRLAFGGRRLALLLDLEIGIVLLDDLHVEGRRIGHAIRTGIVDAGAGLAGGVEELEGEPGLLLGLLVGLVRPLETDADGDVVAGHVFVLTRLRLPAVEALGQDENGFQVVRVPVVAQGVCDGQFATAVVASLLIGGRRRGRAARHLTEILQGDDLGDGPGYSEGFARLEGTRKDLARLFRHDVHVGEIAEAHRHNGAKGRFRRIRERPVGAFGIGFHPSRRLDIVPIEDILQAPDLKPSSFRRDVDRGRRRARWLVDRVRPARISCAHGPHPGVGFRIRVFAGFIAIPVAVPHPRQGACAGEPQEVHPLARSILPSPDLPLGLQAVGQVDVVAVVEPAELPGVWGAIDVLRELPGHVESEAQGQGRLPGLGPVGRPRQKHRGNRRGGREKGREHGELQGMG